MPIVNSEGGAGSAPSSGTSSPSAGNSSQTATTPATTASPATTSTPASTSPSASPSPSTSAPVTAPSSPLPGTDTTGQESSTFNFDEIFQLTEAPAPVALPPVQSVVTPPPEPPVAQPPVAAEAPQPVAQPVAAPATVAAPQPGQQGGSPPPSPADPAGIARLLLENKEAVIDHLAQGVFALSPAEIEALESDAVGTIPKLLSRAVVEAQAMTLQHIARSVPAIIQQYLRVSEANSKNENAFYAAWPAIKPDVHGSLVLRTAQAFRQVNPNATKEQMIAEVGAMVMQLAKLQAPAPVANATNGSRPPSPSPFVPAGAGAVTAPQLAEENPWDILGQHRD